jgi:hypothetical protein
VNSNSKALKGGLPYNTRLAQLEECAQYMLSHCIRPAYHDCCPMIHILSPKTQGLIDYSDGFSGTVLITPSPIVLSKMSLRTRLAL